MPGKTWAEVHHYHLECFRHLSIPEQDQLLAILEASNDTWHESSKGVENTHGGSMYVTKRTRVVNSK